MLQQRNVLLALGIALLAAVICAGLAQQVRAQAGTRLIDIDPLGMVVLDDAGRVINIDNGGVICTVPGAIGVSLSHVDLLTIACANGNIYRAWRYRDTLASPLELYRNALSGAPTPTTPQSWGQVKERYR